MVISLPTFTISVEFGEEDIAPAFGYASLVSGLSLLLAAEAAFGGRRRQGVKHYTGI